MPEDAGKARDAPLGVIERATEQLTSKAEVLRERARVEAAMVPDLLAFDDSPEGERLRRYEFACGRAMSRSLDKMLKLAAGERKKNEDGRMRMGKLVHETTGDYENATNEPIAELENATNEAKLADDSEDGAGIKASTGMNDIDAGSLRGQAEMSLENSAALTLKDRERRRAVRTEETRRLNEQNRKAAELAMAARRDRLRERRIRNGKSGDSISTNEPTFAGRLSEVEF